MSLCFFNSNYMLLMLEARTLCAKNKFINQVLLLICSPNSQPKDANETVL